MSPEAQRIAIAEACGIQDCHWGASGLLWSKFRGWVGDDETGRSVDVPDYLSDLNAMHEALKFNNTWDADGFASNLLLVVCNIEHNTAETAFLVNGWLLYKLANATAAQRAEAFLRTIGKWEDGK